MTNIEFMLEVIQRAKDTRLTLCGVRKGKILAEAQVRMCEEEIACWERIIQLEREAIELRLRGSVEVED